jgi:hypothetical protein
LSGRGVTSVEQATGRPVAIAEVEDALVRHFCSVFDSQAVIPAGTQI